MTHASTTCPRVRTDVVETKDQYERLAEKQSVESVLNADRTVRFKLVSQGENAAGPKMGH